MDCHPHINSLSEVLLRERFPYLVFPQAHGDLHSHVRLRKRLRENKCYEMVIIWPLRNLGVNTCIGFGWLKVGSGGRSL